MEEEFVIFEKYHVSPNELFFLKMLLLYKEEDLRNAMHRYFKLPEEARGSAADILKSLKDKGIILKSYELPKKGESFKPLDVPLSENFQKHVFKASFDMGKELYEHYPVSTIVNGVEYKLRRVSKKFNTLEDAYRAYAKYIHWNPEFHEHIIELVDEAKECGYNFTTLDDFIVDNDWNNLEAMKEEGQLNANTMTML